MTFYFGFAAAEYAVLAIDRRRVDELGNADDSKQKLVRVNEWTYLAGAGLMYFTELVGKIAPQAFGTSQLSLTELRSAIPKWARQIQCGFEDIVQKAPNLDSSTRARVQFCGMSLTGPFSFSWSSHVGLEPLHEGHHAFHMPIFDSSQKNTELKSRITTIMNMNMATCWRLRRALGAIAGLFAWVSAQDECVSTVADVALITKARSRAYVVGA